MSKVARFLVTIQVAEQPDEPADRSVERVRWLEHAMMLVRDFPSWSNAKIAREVGKSPSTLSRSSAFQAFADSCRYGTGDEDA